MNTTLSGRTRRPLLWLGAALLVSGCTSQFAFPWETNPLDPSRIATREPLEVPPDLEILPQPTAGERSDASAGNILFGNPVPRQGEEGDRHQPERLPTWMDAPANRSGRR